MQKYCKLFVMLLATLSMVCGTGAAFAASTYPSKPITLINPSGAGGGGSIFARVLAASFEKGKYLPQPLIAEDKPGGSGGVGNAYVANKKKDPYYLLGTNNTILTVPLMGLSDVTFDGNFTPIAGFCFDEYVLTVSEDSKYKSVQEIIADAKANPKKVSAAGTQVGSGNHILTHLLQKATGVQLTYVGFNSGGEVNAAMLGGHVSIVWSNPGEAMALYQAKKVRFLAIASEKRNASLPDVPTLKELGIDAVYIVGRGVVAPVGIPADAQKILEQAFFKAYNSDLFKQYCKDNVLTPEWMDSATFAKFMAKESAFYKKTLGEMGLVKKK